MGPLGFTLAQTNLNLRGSNGQAMNQLHYLVQKGVFDRQEVPSDPSGLPRLISPYNNNAPLNLRARAWIHGNCAHCHNQVGGTGRGAFDLRWGLSLAQTNICTAKPLTGNIGIPGAEIIKPGDPSKSLLYLRTLTKNPKYRMPQIATHLNDPRGMKVFHDWVEQMTCTNATRTF